MSQVPNMAPIKNRGQEKKLNISFNVPKFQVQKNKLLISEGPTTSYCTHLAIHIRLKIKQPTPPIPKKVAFQLWGVSYFLGPHPDGQMTHWDQRMPLPPEKKKGNSMQ